MRSTVIGVIVVLVLAAGCSDSDDDDRPTVVPDTEATATTEPDTAAPATSAPVPTAPPDAVALDFTVEGVTGGSNVPTEYTCDGANEVPTVNIEGVPASVEELAIIVDDPDAGDSPFVHWAVYGISPETAAVTDGDGSLTYGMTDGRTESWFGPCPPPDDGLHTYRWKLFGLSAALGLESGLDGRALEAAIADSVAAEALLIASYERAS